MNEAKRALYASDLPNRIKHTVALLWFLSENYCSKIEDLTVLKYALDNMLPVLCPCCGIGFQHAERAAQIRKLEGLYLCKIYLAIETFDEDYNDLLLLFYSATDDSAWEGEKENLTRGIATVMAVKEHLEFIDISLPSLFQRIEEEFDMRHQETE